MNTPQWLVNKSSYLFENLTDQSVRELHELCKLHFRPCYCPEAKNENRDE